MVVCCRCVDCFQGMALREKKYEITFSNIYESKVKENILIKNSFNL